jgi:hypothetical protein
MVDTYDCSSELIVQDHKELRDFKDKLLEQFADKINIMDIMLVYDEYKMRLYPI